LSAIERFLARIKELQTAVAERVVAAQARRRSWRVELLQDRIDKAIALSQARATMYASEMGESYQFQVADRAAELVAIADGCRPAPGYVPPPPADWKDAKPPSRLSSLELVLARIKELQTAVAERVVAAQARRRSWRVELLQDRIDKAIALSQARATMYASEMGESYQFQVLDRAAEMGAIADGCTPAPVYIPPPPKDWKDAPPPAPPEYPKTMVHPGFPIGGATGLLMKDYRGKNAEQVIWKFDAALEARIADNLKQVAIEEGQWTEKREVSGGSSRGADHHKPQPGTSTHGRREESSSGPRRDLV
jgi:hypothetical protein